MVKDYPYSERGNLLPLRNDLFNDALNTFYLRLYGIRHMVKKHSYSERGNLLPLRNALFNDALNTFYLKLKHHPYSERKPIATTKNVI